MKYEMTIKGYNTREGLAFALRLIATALDGTGEYPKQDDADIDGASWNDCTVETELKQIA
jgi:hypothetical protein